jgi:hypothetical protein
MLRRWLRQEQRGRARNLRERKRFSSTLCRASDRTNTAGDWHAECVETPDGVFTVATRSGWRPKPVVLDALRHMPRRPAKRAT